MAEKYAGDAFREQFGPWALVAGGSDGIGESFARELAQRGLDIVLLARRKDPLEALAGTLEAEYGVRTHTIQADLTDDGIGEIVEDGTEGREIGLLVYNAGAVHGAKLFHEQPLDHALGLMHLNVRGPLTLAHSLGGRMRERGRGGMLFLTSLAAAVGSSYTTTYAATKSFDLILAEGLWHELAPHGVDVMAVVAGATRTPSMMSSTDGFDDYPGVMEPVDVARGALAQLGRGPMWVAGEANRAVAAQAWMANRVGFINGMSAAGAGIYGLPAVEVAGVDFTEPD